MAGHETDMPGGSTPVCGRAMPLGQEPAARRGTPSGPCRPSLSVPASDAA